MFSSVRHEPVFLRANKERMLQLLPISLSNNIHKINCNGTVAKNREPIKYKRQQSLNSSGTVKTNPSMQDPPVAHSYPLLPSLTSLTCTTLHATEAH
ncbi:hypothetical protein E2C01_001665 [Portunus trituberculatus]|uniref:Uncharacterized protein n=1 Tax=Portunus trituberculatus TaxID=210409 RepID=A0A5B7CN27_PORTR|nr:hypothetical protein [Portunus trituberculatus]